MTVFPLRISAVFVICFLLPGCVGGLLGGGKPVDQFRFGATTTSSQADGPVPAATRFVMLMPIHCVPEIEGDRMLTSTGPKALYIKGARWSAPVPVLFEQLLRGTFRAHVPSIALGDQWTGSRAGRILRVSLERFEAQYSTANSPPTIVIEGEATLFDPKTGLQLGRFHILDRQPASSNNVSAIVSAFDAASTASATRITEWVGGFPAQ